MENLRDALQVSGELPVFYFEKDKQALIQEIETQLEAEDSIVLKGSNGMGLYEVVERLQKLN